MSKIHTLNVVFNTPKTIEGTSLRMTARRYYTDDSLSKGTLTLFFAHATGTHKEHWEPVIEGLFRYQDISSHLKPIREVWTVDNLTHGDAAVLNAQLLQNPGFKGSVVDWGVAIKEFLATHLASQNVIAIGHSGGAGALLNTASLCSATELPYAQLVLVEPGMNDRETFYADLAYHKRFLVQIVAAIKKRRMEWDSHEVAYRYFMQRMPWKAWDPRVVRIFAEKGLYPVHPGATRVKLKCPPRLEADYYEESECEHNFCGTEQIEKICTHIPVHVILSGTTTGLTPGANDTIINPEKGRRPASVTRVAGAGHMLVQELPDRLAERLWHILLETYGSAWENKPANHNHTARL